jgi:hypothetical protein
MAPSRGASAGSGPPVRPAACGRALPRRR